MNKEEVLSVLESLSQLQKDDEVPRNVRTRIANACSALMCETRSISIRVDESIQELDEISEDTNIPVYTRTQIWDIVSKLECIK
ncbi:UPF0147 family protein [archaeon]|nr:UPF0147 family protein [archaeon]